MLGLQCEACALQSDYFDYWISWLVGLFEWWTYLICVNSTDQCKLCDFGYASNHPIEQSEKLRPSSLNFFKFLWVSLSSWYLVIRFICTFLICGMINNLRYSQWKIFTDFRSVATCSSLNSDIIRMNKILTIFINVLSSNFSEWNSLFSDHPFQRLLRAYQYSKLTS